ncbi:MAG: alanine--glyoxylate aminotransferase family protein [Euryarchaeota archaeon]|nr:alanine--glyoxylate aminotransferase family protein [Euryarchaeota archaeon]MBV1729055.1 alanine--glyoxylate aminotransferase family protein [Methanobacterium sp.]MBU4548040.1 alanine--glyoxylate aminotransferase family protein [Euryarchaeota archaeon]MBU4606993.1 alanine--glyoxylate aminotransferase family protein [Euryarchaeota archaeon]MBV1754828.1 alanine--glyoxylate aminotransferase family protein [Methanobacterium sp.]
MNETLLMIPGPTRVAPRVLKAMSENIVNHRSALFGKILTETTQMMSDVFRTSNKSYLITGSGTAAMEAAMANIIQPGDKILNVVGGKFGQRFMQIVDAFGGDSESIEVEWGEAVNPQDIKNYLDNNQDIKAVTVVHNETSTGVANPIKEIGKIMPDYDALYVVDTVSSLGGDEVDVDGYGIDICVTGSQKCLAAPPGMAAITLSDDAWEIVDQIESQSYYLNLKKYRKSGNAEPPETPYTPSVSLMYAMHEALNVIMEEGLNQRIKRHQLAAKATRNAIKALNLELFPKEEVSSTTVTAINIPEGVTDAELRGTMRNKYHVELAGGQDHLKGNIFRVGHMGNITHRELITTISALEMTLRELGFEIEMGEGVASVADVYLPENL